MDAQRINRSLELAAERIGDPAPLLFQRLFVRHPEMERLFVQDGDGQVRGQMVMVAIEALLDCIGQGSYGAMLIENERTNHVGQGVPNDVFDDFFTVLLEIVREAHGDDWTAETARAWHDLLAALTARRTAACASP